MRGIIITLALAAAAAGCLGQYNPPTAPPTAPPQSQPTPPTATPPQSPSPSPTPSPTPTPTPGPTPDGGSSAPPAQPDGGPAAPACAQLASCCQKLAPDQVQGCLDRLIGLDQQTCQGILDQLQSNGACL